MQNGGILKSLLVAQSIAWLVYSARHRGFLATSHSPAAEWYVDDALTRAEKVVRQ